MSDIKAQFDKDVADHQMTILHDDGVYRHLYFAKPGTVCDSFHIVTYPNTLVISGDRECFVFERCDDMFHFFGGMNPRYWAEKVQAESVRSKIKKFSAERFKAHVHDYVTVFLDGSGWPKEYTRALVAEVEDELQRLEESEYECVHWVNNYNFSCESGVFEFSDFWEHDCDKYSHNYLWCCLAIVYAIAAYRNAKDSQYSGETEDPEEPCGDVGRMKGLMFPDEQTLQLFGTRWPDARADKDAEEEECD